MDISTRFILFQVLIIVPFASGMAAKRLCRIPDLSGFTKRLIRVNLVVIEPIIALWSTWGLTLTQELILLPLSGVFLVMSGMIFGKVFKHILGLSGKKGATFLISSTLANHGFTMGAFLCYLFIGEQGLGLAFLFISYFMPFIFLVIFPYARRQSTGKPFDLASAFDYFLSLQNMPLFAIILSLILLALGFGRPHISFPVDVFIIISMALYYFTLGLNFELPAFVASGKENAVLAVIKFLLVPSVTLIILKELHLNPAIETVIFIQSFMPAAIYSVVSSVLFDLDAGFASNMFVWNSIIFLIGILPAIFLFRGFFLGILV
jgi:malate permease and related proteins